MLEDIINTLNNYYITYNYSGEELVEKNKLIIEYLQLENSFQLEKIDFEEYHKELERLRKEIGHLKK